MGVKQGFDEEFLEEGFSRGFVKNEANTMQHNAISFHPLVYFDHLANIFSTFLILNQLKSLLV